MMRQNYEIGDRVLHLSNVLPKLFIAAIKAVPGEGYKYLCVESRRFDLTRQEHGWLTDNEIVKIG